MIGKKITVKVQNVCSSRFKKLDRKHSTAMKNRISRQQSVHKSIQNNGCCISLPSLETVFPMPRKNNANPFPLFKYPTNTRMSTSLLDITMSKRDCLHEFIHNYT